MQKATFRFVGQLGLLLLTFLFIQSCKQKVSETAKVADVSAYIYAYTSGVVSKTTPIRVRFAREAVAIEEVGGEVEARLYSISPTVAGKAIWEDNRTMLFEPETYLNSGTQYELEVALSKIFDDVPKNARSFKMPFRTKELRYDVQVEGLRAANGANLKAQELHGKVLTGDIAAAEIVEKGLIGKARRKNTCGHLATFRWQ